MLSIRSVHFRLCRDSRQKNPHKMAHKTALKSTPQNGSKSAQKGFTLLEVMVALFIFAVTGTAILKTTAEHLNSLGKIEEITFATWVANNRLTQVTIDATKTWPPKNNQKGESEMVDRIWYWQQTVADTPQSDLKQITISVGLDPEGKGEITSVWTFVAKPVS